MHSKACNFTCGIELLVLTITQNIIIFIIVDIYKQVPTSGGFLIPHLKNIV